MGANDALLRCVLYPGIRPVGYLSLVASARPASKPLLRFVGVITCILADDSRRPHHQARSEPISSLVRGEGRVHVVLYRSDIRCWGKSSIERLIIKAEEPGPYTKANIITGVAIRRTCTRRGLAGRISRLRAWLGC